MRKKNLVTKGAACLLSVSLLAGLTACTSSAEKPADPTDVPAASTETSAPDTALEEDTKESKYNPPGEYPILKERQTITILMPENPIIEDFETNYYTRMIEEYVGVDLEFEYLPAVDGDQKFNVMVASQTELPDILLAIPGLTVSAFGQQGLILPLDEYYADPEIARSFHEVTTEEERDFLLKGSRAIDGHNYGAFRYDQQLGNEYTFRGWINQTWLDNLGLPMPATTDEFYDTLVAFRDNDPNGNGKADEIPMIGANTWNQTPIPFLMNAFIYTDSRNNYLMVDDNGKVDVAFNKPEWKQGLEYISKLVSEGLLSPLSFTQDTDQLKMILNDPDEQVVGSMAVTYLSVYNELESPRRADMKEMAPLTGPEGACYTTFNPSIPGNIAVISKYCADPELAFRVLDFCYSLDMSINTLFGEKDVEWAYCTEEERAQMDINDEVVAYKVLKPLDSIHNKNYANLTPKINNADKIVKMQVKKAEEMVPGEWIEPVVELYRNTATVPENVYTSAMNDMNTAEEMQEIADIQTSMMSYVEEFMTRVIVGDASLDEWDVYVAELDKIGLDRWLELKQTAYDRLNGIE